MLEVHSTAMLGCLMESVQQAEMKGSWPNLNHLHVKEGRVVGHYVIHYPFMDFD